MASRPKTVRVKKRTRFVFSLHPYLGLWEKLILRKHYESEKLQIFILGLPRSGTTLIYQYIVHRLRISYITNRAGHYYLAPCTVTNWQKDSLDNYSSNFQSTYGKVTGDLSPREAGAVWGRFFSIDNYETYQDISINNRCTLQNTIACIQSTFGNLPFINKNVKHLLRIDALSKIFPNAYFIVVERNLEQVALSVLRGRYANLDDPTDWWSVKPPDYLALKKLPVVEQVANQLISLQTRMNEDFFNISQERVIHLSYESFCQNPETVIAHINSVLGGRDLRNTAIPQFIPSQKSPGNHEEMLLIDLIKKYDSTR